jgi:hypothetical protein
MIISTCAENGHQNCSNKACGNGSVAREKSPVNQRVSGIWAGYVGVLLWLIGVQYVSGYRGGVRGNER